MDSKYYPECGEPYKYQDGDRIKFWDEYEGVIRIGTIRHTMSGFDGNGNGYNCIGENYDTDGDDIYEVGENNIYGKCEQKESVPKINETVSAVKKTNKNKKTKIIRVNMPDGSQLDIPSDIISNNHTTNCLLIMIFLLILLTFMKSMLY